MASRADRSPTRASPSMAMPRNAAVLLDACAVKSGALAGFAMCASALSAAAALSPLPKYWNRSVSDWTARSYRIAPSDCMAAPFTVRSLSLSAVMTASPTRGPTGGERRLSGDCVAHFHDERDALPGHDGFGEENVQLRRDRFQLHLVLRIGDERRQRNGRFQVRGGLQHPGGAKPRVGIGAPK